MVNQDTQAELLTTNQPMSLDNNSNMDNKNSIDHQQQQSLFINILTEKADKIKASLDISNHHFRQQHHQNSPLSSNITNSTFSLSPSTSTTTAESMGSALQEIIDDHNNSPEYFVRRFLDVSNLRTIALSDVANLEICLRTRSIT